MERMTVEHLTKFIGEIKPPYDIMDPNTSLPKLKPHRDPKLTDPQNLEDLKKLMIVVDEDQEPNMDEVYPNIFIANRNMVKNPEKLKESGITHILNTADGTTGLSSVPKSSLPDLSDFKYEGLDIHDVELTEDEECLKSFEKSIDIIHNAVEKEKGKIVVNCYIGVSRSSTCVIFYLMKVKKMTAEEAIRTVKINRDILPSNENMYRIANFHNTLYNFPLISSESIPMDPFRKKLRIIYRKDV